MTFLFLTAFIFLSYYYLLQCVEPDSRGTDKVLFPFLMTCAQILLTELLLGLGGVLYAHVLAVLNTGLSFMVILYSHRHPNGFRFRVSVMRDLSSMAGTVKSPMDVFLLVLSGIVVATYLWVLVAAYFLPIRGVDDLYYHLPAIFHYVQTHTISMLPLDIRHQFCYPQNAELLCMWSLLFSQNLRMLDAVNVPFVLISVVAVFALLGSTQVEKRDALFISLLYALCPVVIMQAGSNYIDVIVALFLLLSLHYSMRYIDEPNELHLLCSAVAIGMVCGMKYTALFMTLPLQLAMAWSMFFQTRRHLKLYVPVMGILCCWWYIRNTVVLGSALYPMNITTSGMGFMAGEGHSAAADILVNLRSWMLLFPIDDIGLGSYDGGFGLVFWGFGVPSWFVLCLYDLSRARSAGFARLLLHLQIPLNFVMLLMIPKREMVYASRMSLLVVAVGLFSLGSVVAMINDRIYTSVIKTVCICFCLLSVCLMATSTMPTYRLDKVFSDRRRNQSPSEYRYLSDTSKVYETLSQVWEPLDLLTRDDNPGINCYIASDKALIALAPLYGSRLQNRVVNIEPDGAVRADALVFLGYPDRYDFGRLIRRQINYYGYRVELDEALAGNDYLVVTTSELGSLLLSRHFCMNPLKRDLLCTFYGERWPEEVRSARLLMPYLENNVPVVTSHSLAYGLRNLVGASAMDNVILTPGGNEGLAATSRRLRRFYSLETPVDGYAAERITTIKYRGSSLELYLNRAHEDAKI